MRNVRHLRLGLAIILAVLGAEVAATSTTWGQEPVGRLEAHIDWEMTGGFDIVSYANGTQATREMLHPTTWDVWLTGCTSVNDDHMADPIMSYTWDIAHPNHIDRITATDCRTLYGFPQQDVFRIKLTITTRTGRIATARRYITVKDYLIVSMGDSVAAGEGNPDSLQFVSDLPEGSPTHPVRWVDPRCHRSAWSGHAQAAASLQKIFSANGHHTTVTFVSVACSGAGIAEGIVNPYDGQEPPDGPHDKLLSQIDQVKKLLCAKADGCAPNDPELRNIDALVITVGANDVGFGDIVRECAIPMTTCLNQELHTFKGTSGVRPTVHTCVGDDARRNWHLEPPLSKGPVYCEPPPGEGPNYCERQSPPPGDCICESQSPLPGYCIPFSYIKDSEIASLHSTYDLLDRHLRENLKYSRVFITEYFDPTHYDDGNLCGSAILENAVADNFTPLERFIGGVPPDGIINEYEIEWAHEKVIIPLNAQVQAAADKHGWTYVGGIAAEYANHGYCADDHWIVRYEESKENQINPDGTMHPNIFGHFVYRDKITEALRADPSMQVIEWQPVEPTRYICASEPRPQLPGLFRLSADFGYDNPNPFPITIPIGEDNRFTGQGAQEDLGQPETFFPGKHRVFSFGGSWREGEDFPVFPGWTLDGITIEGTVPDEEVIFCRYPFR